MTTWNVTPSGTGNSALTTACANAQPGDTISLTGRWTGVSLVPTSTMSGTAGNPITFQASSPGAAIFDGYGTNGVVTVNSNHNYLVFDGIEFTNTNYATLPVTNKGFIIRSHHVTVQNCTFNYMQMQLNGAHDCLIQNNTWRYFVASYSSGQPQTSGDMLALLLGAHDNEITGNDMKYAGHSCIAVGDGITGHTYPNNWIHGNTLSNPWYRCMSLEDSASGTIVENNSLLDANSVPTLLSTAHSGLAYSSNAIQLDGQNYVVRNNTIDNAVGIYGVISFGGRYYTGVTPHVLVESKNNQVYGNTISNCLTPSVFAFVQQYVPGTDATVPDMTGNLIHDNIVVNMAGTAYSWDGTTHYEPVLFYSFKGATVWTGLNTNAVHDNWGFQSSSAYRNVYYNSSASPTTTTKSLAQFNGLDANVYSNSASQPPTAPTASFTSSVSSGLAPLSVTFTDTSTGTPTSWAWNFGDGNTSTSQSPVHSFASAGLYTVTLTATNAGGSTSASANITVTVVPPVPPTADFTFTPSSGDAPLTVAFTDTSTHSPTSWGWNFGDSGTSTSQSPSHTFTTEGSFSVVLTATNANGSTTRTQTVAVTVQPPSPPIIPPPSLTLTPITLYYGVTPVLCSVSLSCSETLACSDISILGPAVSPVSVGSLTLVPGTVGSLTLTPVVPT